MRDDAATGLRFDKMHGLGNDFLVIDGRGRAADPARWLSPGQVRALADRRRGVGFDQLVLLADPPPGADLRLLFWNADGSPSDACGNATRCIARAEMDRTGRTALAIATGGGLLVARDAGPGRAAVNLGHPRTEWEEIPLARPCDTLALPLPGAPVATSMGNPHCTFLVPDAEAPDLAEIGPRTETDPLFPRRTNVQLVQVLAADRLRVRVWERGAGITPASGTSSAAALVAAHRRGLCGPRATIVLDGGELDVAWEGDGVWTTGAAATVFSGVLHPSALDAAP
ncbi:diaminopimelate epimerase [Rubellimicrobium sp. CFH 75288]|uniref:diaminopimelate epimerase n=1 Tax=Rubellimicrobium sp. CFH 75288 TaxID=2697034 RepID=UPI0014132CF7|nr:diaminopimelate epimerase [Rubellimicrobium sp. CFH 75288]NAZ36847.1 diaminopimelate epimerase [Rubellimicrobium sp. CFH 75288]